jgi:hypothetical protein
VAAKTLDDVVFPNAHPPPMATQLTDPHYLMGWLWRLISGD